MILPIDIVTQDKYIDMLKTLPLHPKYEELYAVVALQGGGLKNLKVYEEVYNYIKLLYKDSLLSEKVDHRMYNMYGTKVIWNRKYHGWIRVAGLFNTDKRVIFDYVDNDFVSIDVGEHTL